MLELRAILSLGTHFYTFCILNTICLSALLIFTPSLSPRPNSHQPKHPRRQPALWLACSLPGPQKIRGLYRVKIGRLFFIIINFLKLSSEKSLISISDFIWLQRFGRAPIALIRSSPGRWLLGAGSDGPAPAFVGAEPAAARGARWQSKPGGAVCWRPCWIYIMQ